MKRIIFSLAFFTMGLQMSAQQEYYIFIQEEAGQPFYVRMGEKNYSSSSIGHILISSLKDSAYQLAIGFPRDRYPEQLFSIVMGREDRGFDLKQMPDGWALFDLRHLSLIRPASDAQGETAGAGGLRKTDAYSQLMAGLVNDSAVLYTPVVKAPDGEPPKKEPVAESPPVAGPVVPSRAGAVIPAGDSLNQPEASPEGAQPNAIAEPGPAAARKDHNIVQAGSYATPEWSQLIYIDRDSEAPDTIVVFIAVDPSVAEPAKVADTAAVEKPRLQVINSDCRNFAGGQDVDRLRVKILNEKEAYRKATVARVAFKAKCYSVKQVRALSELFDDDAGRYQFLETAYPYVSDTYNFADMVDLFKTEYYIGRFKKLTGK